MQIARKILLVGFFQKKNHVYSYSDSFCNVLTDLGYKVYKFNYRKKFFPYSIINNWLINILLYIKFRKLNPDIIFFIKAETIFSKTIRKLQTNKNLLINFYPDNPFVFWNGNSNKEILNSLPFYNYFLSWSQLLMPVLKSAGAKSVYYFPFAYDENIFYTGIECQRKIYDVCFAGTWELEREVWLTNLMKRMPNLNLVLYGNLWNEKLPKNSILRRYLKNRAVYKDKLIKIFRSSKIVINFIRKQNSTSHNMRTFEVPATRSFLLTQRTREQAELLFSEGENIECFDSLDEFINKIKFYLNNDKLRNDIAAKGNERAKEFELKIVLKKFMEYIHKN